MDIQLKWLFPIYNDVAINLLTVDDTLSVNSYIYNMKKLCKSHENRWFRIPHCFNFRMLILLLKMQKEKKKLLICSQSKVFQWAWVLDFKSSNDQMLIQDRHRIYQVKLYQWSFCVGFISLFLYIYLIRFSFLWPVCIPFWFSSFLFNRISLSHPFFLSVCFYSSFVTFPARILHFILCV